MSYRDYPGQPDPEVRVATLNLYPTTPMVWDVKAIQFLYGHNTSTTGGDDTYTVPVLFNDRLFRTINDAAGNDTLDAVNAVLGMVIDLHPGAGSQIGPMVSWSGPDAASTGSSPTTLFLSTSTLIENARGSFGSDRIIGNSADNRLDGYWGSDALNGDAGNDTLVGNRGFDTFQFSAGKGNDTVVDFLSGEDFIALADFLNNGRFLLFEDLDTAPNGTLDDADEHVAVSDLSGDGVGDLVLNLTPFAPDGTPSVITLLSVSGLTREDFV
jgi:Ca2+-binding RTX toxin-like protein